MSDFDCGANEEGYHLTGVNWGRDLKDLPSEFVVDLRNVIAGDPSPDGKGTLEICRGIEVGHVFQLGTKYSQAMSATFLDESGQSCLTEMGCYGIGITRVIAAAIEQNNDERGIIWPLPMTPFQVAIVPIGANRSDTVREAAGILHDELEAAGIETILDDRDERPGVMFADMELIGVPHRVVVSERNLKQEQLEYQGRRDATAQQIPLLDAVTILKLRLCAD
jgi:prolyl-tRNA synthetase